MAVEVTHPFGECHQRRNVPMSFLHAKQGLTQYFDETFERYLED